MDDAVVGHFWRRRGFQIAVCRDNFLVVTRFKKLNR